MEHIVDKFTPCFEGVEHVTTFKALALKHEQNLELRSATRHERGVGGVADGHGMAGAGHMSAIAAAEWRKARELDDDEAYFETSDDNDSDHVNGEEAAGACAAAAKQRRLPRNGAARRPTKP